jgi:tetratricopeptide (TPR) repeat protein
MLANTRLLLRLLWKPGAAMSEILDWGSLLYSSLAALVATWLLEHSLGPFGRLLFSFYLPLLVLAAVYVPINLLIVNLLGRLGSMHTVFERDYSALLTCTAMVWTATCIPLILAAWIVPLVAFAVLTLAAILYFAILMFFAVRTVFGVSNGVAAGTVLISWLPTAGAVLLAAPLRFLLGWLASPFFLIFAYFFLGAELAKLGGGLRGRQNFRRMLDAAALNPHDASAQYQLGLIYQQRRRYPEAIERFRNAVTIDPSETDAHFQLGRIARQQGRLNDALAHFQTVIDQDERHSLSDILREVGAVYLTVHQYEDARRELATFIERRPYDPEGLFYYGQALEGLNKLDEARSAYARAIEAARTAAPYRRRETARWSRLAHKQLKKLR